jgi:hypothetical protein
VLDQYAYTDEVQPRSGRWQAVAVALLLVVIVATPVFKIGNLPPLRFDDIMIGVLFLAAWIWSQRRGENFLFGPGKALLSTLFILLTVVYVITYLVGLEAGRYPYFVNDAFYTPATLVRLMMYFIVGASIRPDARGWRLIVWAILAAGIIQGLSLMIQYYDIGGLREMTAEWWGGFEKIGDEARPGSVIRATGTTGNPNSSAAVLAMAIGVPLGMLLFSRGMLRRLIIPAISVAFLMGAIAFWTLSRAATVSALGAAAMTLLLPLLISKYRGRIMMAAPLVIIGAVGLYVSMDLLPVPNRVKALFMPTGTEETAIDEGMVSRTQIWAFRMQEVGEQGNAMTGFGPSKYLDQTVDNDYVAAYYRTGLFGLLLVLGIRLAATGRSVMNFARVVSPVQSLAASSLFCMNISLLLFGLTADVTLGPKLGPIIALGSGIIVSLGVGLRQEDELIEDSAQEAEPAYAAVS